MDIPVFGGFEPAALIAMSLADRIAVVTVMQNVVPVLERHIAMRHLQGRIPVVRSVNIPVLDLSDHKKLCDAVIRESVLAIEKDNAHAIVLGCTGTVDVTETVQAALLEKGYEQADTLILQGHLDMVCKKEEGLDFDFTKDGIQL